MAAVNFSSTQSGWLTESTLGKHSALPGGEAFGINRRYYHCEATGGMSCRSVQLKAAVRTPAVGHRAASHLLSFASP